MSAHESITSAIILKDKGQDKRSISQKLQDHDVSHHSLLSRENRLTDGALMSLHYDAVVFRGIHHRYT